jgi:hypothetical protein
MADAESPQTLFNIMKTHLPLDKKINLSYDNACNLIHYVLNREPDLIRNVRLFIDALHFKTHKRCLASYDTGALPVARTVPCVGGCQAPLLV